MSVKASVKKKNDRAEKQIAAGITSWIGKLVSFYVILMMAVFPLFITDKYYNCLKDKYYFFFYATAALAAAVLFLYLAGAVMGAFKAVSIRKVFGKIGTTDKFMLLFLAAALVSTVFSEWRFESFWGNMGRLQGLFFYILITVSYFIVTRAYSFQKKHIWIFLSAGIVISLWGIADYLGIDPLGWREDAGDYWGMLIFTSTIGNVNTFTAAAALFFGVSAYLSVSLERPWFAWISVFVTAMAMITGQSDNAVLAMAAVMAVLPFMAFGNRKGFIRYFVLVSVLSCAFAVTGLLTLGWSASEVLPVYSWGILLKLSNEHTDLCIAAAAVSALTALVCACIWKKDPKKHIRGLITVWGCLCALALCAVVFVIIDANSGRHEEFWKPYAGILVFNDSWGNNRGFAWRNTFEFFRNFDVFKKLFGSGPETYPIYMAENCYYEMIERSNTIFDSPHSEPVQILFTTGIVGLIAYYGVFVSALMKALKKNRWARACAIAVISYICASVINISVPITTPLFFLLMELSITIGDKDEETV